eukprot:4041958-Pyramimonas_sp.AAC.1
MLFDRSGSSEWQFVMVANRQCMSQVFRCFRLGAPSTGLGTVEKQLGKRHRSGIVGSDLPGSTL